MIHWAWIVALFVYLLVGGLLLLRLSDRDRSLAPELDWWFGVVQLLGWPFLLATWATFRLPDPPTAPEPDRQVRTNGLPPAGIATTDLCPGGTVEVAGRRYAATAEGEPVRAGEPVAIVGRAGRTLRVRACPADPPSKTGTK